MTSAECQELKAAMSAIRSQLRWLSRGVIILALLHGPDILKLITAGG